METENKEKISMSDLSTTEIAYLASILQFGAGHYKHHIPEIDSLVKKGLLIKGEENEYFASDLAKHSLNP